MAEHRHREARTRLIPARIHRQLLRMPDIEGSWVAIAPRRRAKRAKIIANDPLRGEVERLAAERGFHPGDYSLFQVARKRETPENGVAAEIRKLTHWARRGNP